MAYVLSSGRRAATPAELARLWPVDKLILAYLGASTILIFFYWRDIPYAAGMAGLHATAALLVAAFSRRPGTPATTAFRHWYPLLYVAAIYREMGILIPAVRGINYDHELARLDYRLWGAHPTVWLERYAVPWFTSALQLLYALFVPAVLLTAVLFWTRKRYPEFRYYAFLVSAGFLTSYIGYLLVPARGPRFLLAGLQSFELRGPGGFSAVRRALDILESAHFDCFPSGHTELTIIAWWASRRLSAALFIAYAVYTACIVLATVYLRYHYTVDIAAGAALALVLLVFTPGVYRMLGDSGYAGNRDCAR
jgi:membrane-associated phospholipid phosphatase